MSSSSSKPIDPAAPAEAAEEGAAVAAESSGVAADSSGVAADSSGVAADSSGGEGRAPDAGRKKKSRKRKIRDALVGKGKSATDGKPSETDGKTSETDGKPSEASGKQTLSREQLEALMEVNPAMKADVSKMDSKGIESLLKHLTVSDMLTGLSGGGKNQKDMASYKFWSTQPVPNFEEKLEKGAIEDGPIKQIDIERVPKEPPPMVDGFEWVTMNLEDETELKEVYDLLSNHYVEDDEAMFRFNYSSSFLNWALKAPGWRKEWHVGVRTTASRKLVAFISGIPVSLRVRKTTINTSEINFLCIHKKLRSKRLAPTLIKEITRRCYLEGTFQAIYTAGVILPTPVATCRYFHRSIDWEKLYDVGFSPLPHGSTKARQISKYKLPAQTSTHGLRPMRAKDIDQVLSLLQRYLSRMEMAQVFTRDEVEHWLLHKDDSPNEQVIWSYVVEDPATGKITDFFSFYCLESSVIRDKLGRNVRAAYLYYYATETAWEGGRKELKARLNVLMRDALVLAKEAKFDVLNALTLLDSPLFLEEQKFGAGDGQLHYYLYNYRTAVIPGGVDAKNQPSDEHMGGVGVVML
ncbi:Glycylpeptide N-tetradecanoyltransferase [Saccharata proteae CBS 121410]|uniref:Glycylpeptide N-tetradecanoyltransferase n=1 Tax=Saccharata proteae CBS 121410 TaxID=1314787 RepID=A0A6A5YBC5_9PEZI|nr:Glycylpeptide N-tetradecanoyltransferase [Saccharata proteae CBS 121410]